MLKLYKKFVADLNKIKSLDAVKHLESVMKNYCSCENKALPAELSEFAGDFSNHENEWYHATKDVVFEHITELCAVDYVFKDFRDMTIGSAKDDPKHSPQHFITQEDYDKRYQECLEEVTHNARKCVETMSAFRQMFFCKIDAKNNLIQETELDQDALLDRINKYKEEVEQYPQYEKVTKLVADKVAKFQQKFMSTKLAQDKRFIKNKANQKIYRAEHDYLLTRAQIETDFAQEIEFANYDSEAGFERAYKERVAAGKLARQHKKAALAKAREDYRNACTKIKADMKQLLEARIAREKPAVIKDAKPIVQDAQPAKVDGSQEVKPQDTKPIQDANVYERYKLGPETEKINKLLAKVDIDPDKLLEMINDPNSGLDEILAKVDIDPDKLLEMINDPNSGLDETGASSSLEDTSF